MKKRLLYISCMLILTYFGTSSLKGQVVVGKDVLPEAYSLLQIEYDVAKYPNGAGLQLPRISESERTALQNDISADANSAGLVIFNTTTSRIEYWNGRDWVAIPGIVQPSFIATNGLNDVATATAKTQAIKLGGTLNKPTDIALSEKSFTIDQQGTARLEIGPITVKDNKVGIGVTTLTGGVDADPTARLHIEKDAMQTHGLRISDGSEGINKVMTAQDANGAGKWAKLEEVTTLSQGTIRSSGATVGYSGTTVNYTEISTTTGRVTCTAGKWLIIGRFMSRNSAKQTNYYSWAKLQNTATNEVYAIAGMKTEPGGLQYSIPQVFYFGEFSSTVTIGLYAAAPNSGGTSTGSSILGTWGGTGFLHAIKLAD